MKKKSKAKKKNNAEIKRYRADDECRHGCTDTGQPICPECAEWAESVRQPGRHAQALD